MKRIILILLLILSANLSYSLRPMPLSVKIINHRDIMQDVFDWLSYKTIDYVRGKFDWLLLLETDNIESVEDVVELIQDEFADHIFIAGGYTSHAKILKKKILKEFGHVTEEDYESALIADVISNYFTDCPIIHLDTESRTIEQKINNALLQMDLESNASILVIDNPLRLRRDLIQINKALEKFNRPDIRFDTFKIRDPRMTKNNVMTAINEILIDLPACGENVPVNIRHFMVSQ